jgi:hemerythrin superfamily protein
MNAITRMAPSITTMIRMDHTHAMTLFHRFKADTSLDRKRALVRNACLAIEIHAQLEEEIFYPAMRSVLIGDEVLDKSEPEHQRMRQLLGELRERLGADDDASAGTAFDDKFMDLMRLVIHHVADEETQLLPAAERLLADRLSDLGVEMTRRRIELLKPHAGELAATTIRSFPVGAVAGAALLTAGAMAVGAMLFSRGSRSTQGRRLGRW